MNSLASYVVDEPNLSLAWAQAFARVTNAPGKEVAPMLVSFAGVSGDEPDEDPNLRAALDRTLAESGMQGSHTVANTIFPQLLWRRADGDRAKLYADYVANVPSYVAMSPKNRRGLYFARLVAFDLDPKTGERSGRMPVGGALEDGNQLEFIIQQCRPGVRRSMFQASVFDPTRDHSASARLGFPCLQHLTFVPRFGSGTLQINAFYATQYVFERAYGNFLGLARLGIFVAKAVGLALERVNCFVGVEQLGQPPARGQGFEALQAALAGLGDADPTVNGRTLAHA